MPKEITFLARYRSAVLTGGSAVLLLLYVLACLVVFRNSDFIEGMKGKPVSNSLAERELKTSGRHTGTYYREVAERLQFYAHDPELVSELYKMALRKAPADYRIPSSYAYYLVSRRCCREDVAALLEEALKRNPTSWKMHRFAAAYLLSINQLKNALPHFRSAIELQPHSAQELYELLEQKGIGFETLSKITPNRTDTRLQFAFYLSAKGDAGKQELKNILDTLQEMPLKPEQRLATAEIALRAGRIQLAEKQASLALQSKGTKVNAFQLLADIAWHQRNWAEFEKRSADLERFYLQTGEREKAAEYALNTVNRLAAVKTKGETKKNLLKVLNDHPQYAPAYEQMANFSQNESEQITLYYLKKAVQLAPDRLEYKDRLAQHYLSQSRISEAETIYNELVLSAQGTQTGYLGLSRCSLARNNPLMAITILEDGLQKSGKSAELYFELGKIFNTIRDYKRAAESYRELNSLSPDNVEGYILAADAYRNLGDYTSARELYEQALKRDPDNQRASESLLQLDSVN